MPHASPEFVRELESSAIKLGLSLSKDSRELLDKLERSFELRDTAPNDQLALSVFIREVPLFREILRKNGIESNRAADIAEQNSQRSTKDKYHDSDSDMYGSIDGFGFRSSLGSAIFTRVRLDDSKTISPKHIVVALLDAHDEENPPLSNSEWNDQELQSLQYPLTHFGFQIH